ncbi:MAG: hypothetical protein IT348_00410 [Candidatus Eisenbacteria bacterium]|nr:hypothetical protein [Candidatus Eisenbacteria bacterium]
MKPLDQAFDREWIWTRPRIARRHWELRAGDDVLATLEARAWVRSRMAGETAAGARSLAHHGWFRGRVLLTDAAGATIATFQPAWFGHGQVNFVDGPSLRWTRADFWGRRWEFRDGDGLVQLSFLRRPSWFRSTTAVQVSDAGRKRPELAELVLLGFYLLQLMQRQTQAAH